MSRHPITDGWKIVLSGLAGVLLSVVVVGLVIAGLFVSCQKLAGLDIELGEAQEQARITDTVIVTVAETVYVRDTAAKKAKARSDSAKRLSDSLDAAVAILNDSTAMVQDSGQVELPPLVIADLRALRATVAQQDTTIRKQGSLITALYAKDTTWQWRFDAHQKVHKLELAKANAPRWGYGATLGMGCSAIDRCGWQVTAGLTYQAKLPSPKQLLRKVF